MKGLGERGMKTVETHGRASLAKGRASLAGILRETHGRASLLALLFLFAACEKDVVEKSSEGKVAVHFAISSVGYEADRVRSVGEKAKPERVSVYLGEGVYMRASLVPDEEEDVRAATTSSLIDNQKVWMAAYDPSDAYNQVGITAKYHFSESQNRLVLDDPDAPLEVEPNKTYYFAAFSYYKSTDNLSETNIHPNSDLIWASASKEITETEAGRTVSMVLKHKFSRVRVKLNAGGITGATISALGTVQVTGAKTANLDLQTGDLSETATAVTQTVNNWYPALSTATTWSDYVPFYSTPTSVTISSVTLTVNSTPHSYGTRTANFSHALFPEKSYTLVVDFDRLVFARSNIVWDNANSKLTFAVTPTDNATIPASVQGLAFKWGSLVALSMTRTYDPGSLGWMSYKPENITYSPSGNKNYSWTAVPYIDDLTGLSYNNGDYFADYNNGLGYNSSVEKGDICRYISAQGWVTGEWRIPTFNEFLDLLGETAPVMSGTFTLYQDKTLPMYNATYKGGIYAYGIWELPGYLLGTGAAAGFNMSNPSVGVFLPASGQIFVMVGGYESLDRITAGGNATNAAAFFFTGSSQTDAFAVFIENGTHRMSKNLGYGAYPIRCVRID
jgi:hypothetical protein